MYTRHKQHPQGARRWVPRCYAATLSQRGISLIELIMFIVIVSVALAGILLVMNTVTRGSADPLIHKQALAIAESMLEEVELMPFTFCDPDDANAATATATTGTCAVAANEESTNIGPELGETRYHPTTPFDNVSDYNTFDSNNDGGVIKDVTSAIITDSAGVAIPYRVQVTVAKYPIAVVLPAPAVPDTESLQITVTVTGPDNVGVTVDGLRTRYSPTI